MVFHKTDSFFLISTFSKIFSVDMLCPPCYSGPTAIFPPIMYLRCSSLLSIMYLMYLTPCHCSVLIMYCRPSSPLWVPQSTSVSNRLLGTHQLFPLCSSLSVPCSACSAGLQASKHCPANHDFYSWSNFMSCLLYIWKIRPGWDQCRGGQG